MSLETGTPSEPTAEAAATPTETVTATTPAPASTGTAAVGTTERTYTQADMDRAAAWYRKSLREMEERSAQARPQPETDPALRAQIEAIIGPVIAPIKQQSVEATLDRAVVSLGKRYPEFTDEAKVRAIFGTVVDMGLDKSSHLPIESVLEMGYRYWKHDELSKLAAQPPVDVEAIKKQAADEAVKAYLTKKTTTAAATPKQEGSGGATPANTDRERLKTKRGAFEAALERVTKSRALTD